MSEASIPIRERPRLAVGAWVRRHPLWAAGLAYLALAGLAFPSVVLNLSTAIPGILGREGDYSIFYWNIWWFQHAIFRLGQNPYFTNYILFPHTINLAYHTFAPLIDVLAIPLYALFGLTPAVNVLTLGILVFNGLTMFVFLKHHGLPLGLAFIGGLLFTFNSMTVMRVSMSHLSYLPIGWLPLSLLACDWLIERKTIGSAILFGSVLYGALMTDLQFGLWLGLLLPAYALYRWARSDRRARLRLFKLGLLSLAILLGFMMVAPLPQILAGKDVAYPHVSMDSGLWSLDPGKIIGIAPRLIESEEKSTLGLLLPALVIVGIVRARRDRTRWLWLLYGIVFLILALGPTLRPFEIPLPYRLIHEATAGFYRTPIRFIVHVILMLIVFAMMSWKADYERLRPMSRIAVMVVVSLAVALENRWYEPFPIFSAPDYRIYHAIGAESGDYLVLEVPVGPFNAVTQPFGRNWELEYYATIHHKRLINGQISRGPLGIAHDYRQWRLITALAQERPLPDLVLARQEFQQLTNEWDIRYVLIHRDMLWENVANWATAFFNTQPGWCLVDEEGPLLAYRRMDGGVCPQPDLLRLPANGVIQIGDGHDDRYLGFGWYPAENVGGPQARWTGEVPTTTLQVRLPPQVYHVTLRATAYPVGEKLTVEANGQRVAEFAVGDGWNEYGFELPADSIGPDGLTTLNFIPMRTESAYERTNGQVDDRRPLAVAYDAITFMPISGAP